MNLSEEQIQEFQRLYKKESGKDITYKDASIQAINLVGLFEIVVDINKASVNNDAVIDKNKSKDLKELNTHLRDTG